MNRSRVIAALVLAVALVATGCGGGGSDTLSKSDYEKAVRQSLTDYVRALAPLQSGSQSNGQVLADVSKAQVTLTNAAARLKKLKPPKDAAADNAKIATAISGLAQVFTSLKQALASRDFTKAQATARAYQKSTQSQDLTEAIADLKKRGYDLSGAGSS